VSQTRAHYENATLDVFSHGLILRIPSLYSLDIDFSASDAQLAASFTDEDELSRIRSLRRSQMSGLDIDGAKAQWFVSDRVLVVTV
jgi:hypothetical protein